MLSFHYFEVTKLHKDFSVHNREIGVVLPLITNKEIQWDRGLLAVWHRSSGASSLPAAELHPGASAPAA